MTDEIDRRLDRLEKSTVAEVRAWARAMTSPRRGLFLGGVANGLNDLFQRERKEREEKKKK